MVERRNQLWCDRLRAAGSADGLAVEGDHPPAGDHGRAGPHEHPEHTVQHVRVQAGERTPDRRFRRPVRAAAAQRRDHLPGLVGGPLPNRGERARAGQDRADPDGKDHPKGMAHSARVARVRHGPEKGQQVRVVRQLRTGGGFGRR